MRAFITGITGQDGSYLAELLLGKNYEVHGLVRRVSTDNLQRIRHIQHAVALHTGDLSDAGALAHTLAKVEPDEVYNLAAQSHVGDSFNVPAATFDVVAMGAVRLLQAVREVCPGAHYYQASSSEMFGKVAETPQREQTPFHPRSPYGVAKCAAHWATVNARESYGLHASCGILFNHESPRRGDNFVTQKVAKAAAAIAAGRQAELVLGNLDARRDWGYAGDYVEAMWRMVTAAKPADYVVATGVDHSVRELCEVAFSHVGMDYLDYVKTSVALQRPAEVDTLLGDSSRARVLLGWRPKVTFEEMICEMVEAVR